MQALLYRFERGWIFTENDNPTTSIEWSYSFVPKSEDAKIQIEENPLEPFEARLWRGPREVVDSSLS